MAGTLRLLSGGAVQGLVSALAPAFEAETGLGVDGTFGAVGAMRDRLLAGEPADLVVLTQALVRDLAQAGMVAGADAADIGPVETGIAVRAGDPAPPFADGDALRSALLAADAIYLPDPDKATAGIHVAAVIGRLGILGEVRDRLRPCPNGAAAMGELARSGNRRPIGCTQVTEILIAPGVTLVGPLPPGYGLATIYTAAPCSRASHPKAARAFVRRLAGAETAPARAAAGFSDL